MKPEVLAVSIIVPARNEEHNIRHCLHSLQQQEGPPLEIIVVDDQSNDGTPDVVRQLAAQDYRIRLIRVTDLPAGWIGKTYALCTGLKIAKGERVLFTDADTYHYPSALAQALAFAQSHDIDCLSYSPEQDCGTLGELLLQPAVFQLLNERFPYEQVSDPRYEEAVATGQFILITRKALEAIGSYSVVKDKIVEDVEIARLVKKAGFRLHFAFGKRIVRTRMYHSFQECWRGWAKNLYLLRERGPRSLVAATCTRVGLDLMPVGVLISLMLWPIPLDASLLHAVAFACGLLILGRMLWLGHAWSGMGFQAKHAMLYPVSSLLLVGLLWYSFYRHAVVGEVEWKGRQYSTTA